MHCQAALGEADQVLHGRYDRIDLPVVRPVVTRVERYAGHCRCCGGVTLAPVPEGMAEGSPFSVNILALAIYLRFTHAISYRRLTQLFQHLFALHISEGALDAMFQRARPCFGNEFAAILARLRRSRIICSDETTVRIDGRTHWNWVFQNDQVVIHVIRNSRAASVVSDVLAGHRPSIWVSDLYGAQQGHADLWQVCLAHQLRDCQYAIEAGDAIFAPRMKMLLLRAVVLARRRKELAESTRRSYQCRLDRELNAIMVLAPVNQHGRRLRKRYGKVRSHLFTFLEHPDVPPDNNGSERELRPTATYRKVTGGFRSRWGADLFADIRSVLGTAHDAEPTHIRQFSQFCAGDQSSKRVEQLPTRTCSGKLRLLEPSSISLSGREQPRPQPPLNPAPTNSRSPVFDGRYSGKVELSGWFNGARCNDTMTHYRSISVTNNHINATILDVPSIDVSSGGDFTVSGVRKSDMS